MKKKTLIILSTIVFTLILGCVLLWRIHLISLDTSGIYLLPTENLFEFIMNYMPELTIIVTIITIYARKRWGLIFSVTSSVMAILSLFIEVLILVVRSMEIKPIVPTACVPLMDIPIIVICIILFIIKFKIYTIPKEIRF